MFLTVKVRYLHSIWQGWKDSLAFSVLQKIMVATSFWTGGCNTPPGCCIFVLRVLFKNRKTAIANAIAVFLAGATKKIYSAFLRMNSNSHIIVSFLVKSFADAHGEIIHSVNCEILLPLVAMWNKIRLLTFAEQIFHSEAISLGEAKFHTPQGVFRWKKHLQSASAFFWWPVGESNSCYRRERAVS